MKLRKILALILALALCFTLVACGGSADDTTDDKKDDTTNDSTGDNAGDTTDDIGDQVTKIEPKNGEQYVIAFSSIAYAVAPFATVVGDSMEQYVLEKGWKFNVLSAEGDVELQAEQISQLINTDPDLLVIWAGDSSLAELYCEEAKDAGIPVMCIISGIVDGESKGLYEAFVGPDQYDLSYRQAQYMVEHFGADTERLIVSVSGIESQQAYIDALNGFLDALKDEGVLNEDGSAGKWTFVGPEYCLASRDTAQAAMENYISTYGDKIDAVIGFDDDLSMGCVNAIQEAGLGDEIEVWSRMGMKEMIQAIRDGKAYMTVYEPAFEITKCVADCIEDYFNGVPQDQWDVSPDDYYVTPDNCYEYDGDY